MLNLDGAVRLAQGAAHRHERRPSPPAPWRPAAPHAGLRQAAARRARRTVGWHDASTGRASSPSAAATSSAATTLFTTYQPIWDPRITWAGERRACAPSRCTGRARGIAANTYAQGASPRATPSTQALLHAPAWSRPTR